MTKIGCKVGTSYWQIHDLKKGGGSGACPKIFMDNFGIFIGLFKAKLLTFF